MSGRTSVIPRCSPRCCASARESSRSSRLRVARAARNKSRTASVAAGRHTSNQSMQLLSAAIQVFACTVHTLSTQCASLAKAVPSAPPQSWRV